MKAIRGWLAFSLTILAAAAPVQAAAPEEENRPFLMQLMLSPTRNGMFVRLPYVDTDPNRGVTVGLMPVWVSISEKDYIRHIHIPTVDYNRYVGITGGYEYYYFPAADTNVHFFSYLSEKYERAVVAEYATESFLGKTMHADGHLEYSRDGSKRFFGFGDNTPKSAESNYTLDQLDYRFGAGIPLREGGPFRANVQHELEAAAVRAGAVTEPNDLVNVYPAVAAQTHARHRDAYLRGSFSYDTRDSPITTSQGTFGEIFARGAQKDVLGQYSYQQYGIRLKKFLPFYRKDDAEPSFITAGRFRLEQVRGDPAFWVMPQLGGKYIHRGYGEGRYIEHGLLLFGIEERCRVYARRISGLMASFWVDPFLDMGTVFPSPELMQAKYIRPAGGIALRGVGRPQIVGSADIAYGMEGLKAFLDINYAF